MTGMAHHSKITRGMALMNLVKSFIGSGILALPAHFQGAGILGSNLLFPVVAFLVWCGMTYLLEAMEEQDRDPAKDPAREGLVAITDALTDSETGDDEPPVKVDHSPFHYVGDSSDPYTDLVDYVFHKNAFMHASYVVAIILFQFGACMAYVSVIDSNLRTMLPDFSRAYVGIAFGIIFAALTQIRNQKSLAFTSVLGNLVYVLLVVVVVVDGGRRASDNGWFSGNKPVVIEGGGMAQLFGTAVFSLEGIGSVLILRGALKNPADMQWVINMGLSGVCALYMAFGSICYALFGDLTTSPITQSLRPGLPSTIVRISLIVALCFTYAIQMFPITSVLDDIIWNRMTGNMPHNMRNGHKSFFVAGSVLRVGLVILTVFVSLIWGELTSKSGGGGHSFNQMVDISGAVAGSFVGFLLPTVIIITMTNRHRLQSRFASLVLAWRILIIMIGLTAGATSVYYAISE